MPSEREEKSMEKTDLALHKFQNEILLISEMPGLKNFFLEKKDKRVYFLFLLICPSDQVSPARFIISHLQKLLPAAKILNIFALLSGTCSLIVL